MRYGFKPLLFEFETFLKGLPRRWVGVRPALCYPHTWPLPSNTPSPSSPKPATRSRGMKLPRALRSCACTGSWPPWAQGTSQRQVTPDAGMSPRPSRTPAAPRGCWRSVGSRLRTQPRGQGSRCLAFQLRGCRTSPQPWDWPTPAQPS